MRLLVARYVTHRLVLCEIPGPHSHATDPLQIRETWSDGAIFTYKAGPAEQAAHERRHAAGRRAPAACDTCHMLPCGCHHGGFEE